MHYHEPRNVGITSVVRSFPTRGSLEDHGPRASLDELETIDPRPLPPWRTETFTEIEIETDRETARERAEAVRSTSDIVVYSDASGREGHLGAAVVALDDNLEVIESQQVQVGPMDRWSVHVAELIGIFYAISTVFKIGHQRPGTADRCNYNGNDPLRQQISFASNPEPR